MTATSSMQRLWLVVLCMVVAVLPVTVDANDYEIIDYFPITRISPRLDRLKAIRDGLSQFGRHQDPFLKPSPYDRMYFEVPALRSWHLRYVFYSQVLDTKGFVDFDKAPDLNPQDADYDKRVAYVLMAFEGLKTEADNLLLESLSGPDDPFFLSIIDWHRHLPER